MIRIKWIDPGEEGTPKHIEGELRGKTIVLFKGRAKDLTEAHERAHIALGHYRHKRFSPERYVRGELDANLYTYKKMGKPRRLIMELRGLLEDLEESWDMSNKEGLKFISQGFKVLGDKIPVGWSRDLERLRSEVYAS